MQGSIGLESTDKYPPGVQKSTRDTPGCHEECAVFQRPFDYNVPRCLAREMQGLAGQAMAWTTDHLKQEK